MFQTTNQIRIEHWTYFDLSNQSWDRGHVIRLHGMYPKSIFQVYTRLGHAQEINCVIQKWVKIEYPDHCLIPKGQNPIVLPEVFRPKMSVPPMIASTTNLLIHKR